MLAKESLSLTKTQRVPIMGRRLGSTLSENWAPPLQNHGPLWEEEQPCASQQRRNASACQHSSFGGRRGKHTLSDKVQQKRTPQSHRDCMCVCVLSQRASRSDAMILKRRGKGSYSTMPPEDPVIMTCSVFFFFFFLSDRFFPLCGHFP